MGVSDTEISGVGQMLVSAWARGEGLHPEGEMASHLSLLEGYPPWEGVSHLGMRFVGLSTLNLRVHPFSPGGTQKLVHEIMHRGPFSLGREWVVAVVDWNVHQRRFLQFHGLVEDGG